LPYLSNFCPKPEELENPIRAQAEPLWPMFKSQSRQRRIEDRGCDFVQAPRCMSNVVLKMTLDLHITQFAFLTKQGTNESVTRYVPQALPDCLKTARFPFFEKIICQNWLRRALNEPTQERRKYFHILWICHNQFQSYADIQLRKNFSPSSPQFCESATYL